MYIDNIHVTLSTFEKKFTILHDNVKNILQPRYSYCYVCVQFRLTSEDTNLGQPDHISAPAAKYQIFTHQLTKYLNQQLCILGQSPRHNICAFIELPCYLNCFIKIAYIMLNKYSDSNCN